MFTLLYPWLHDLLRLSIVASCNRASLLPSIHQVCTLNSRHEAAEAWSQPANCQLRLPILFRVREALRAVLTLSFPVCSASRWIVQAHQLQLVARVTVTSAVVMLLVTMMTILLQTVGLSNTSDFCLFSVCSFRQIECCIMLPILLAHGSP